MASSVTTGDGYVGADEISAGTVANGTVEIKKGSYSVTTFKSGAPDIGHAPTTSTIILTRNPMTPHSTDVTVEDPDTPGFNASIDVGYNNPGGSGYLEILNGATLTSRNEGYDAYGHIVGGYNNVRIGSGYDSFGKVTVDGAGSKLLAYGGSARIGVGRDGGTLPSGPIVVPMCDRVSFASVAAAAGSALSLADRPCHPRRRR